MSRGAGGDGDEQESASGKASAGGVGGAMEGVSSYLLAEVRELIEEHKREAAVAAAASTVLFLSLALTLSLPPSPSPSPLSLLSLSHSLSLSLSRCRVARVSEMAVAGGLVELHARRCWVARARCVELLDVISCPGSLRLPSGAHKCSNHVDVRASLWHSRMRRPAAVGASQL